MNVDAVYELIASWRLGQVERYTRAVRELRRQGGSWDAIARIVRMSRPAFRRRFPGVA